MSPRRAYIKLFVALVLTSIGFLTSSAFGQSPANPPTKSDKGIATAQESKSETSATKVAVDPKRITSEKNKAVDDSKPSDLKGEIEAVKAENAAVREQLRKMEEQQKAMLELVERLQRRLDGATSATLPATGQTTEAATAADATLPVTSGATVPAPVTDAPADPSQPTPVQNKPDDDRYRDGIIIWQTSDDAKIPFLLRFNNNTQLRYLNTTSSPDTFTDHLGNVREVHNRNDITVNRSMFFLNGYIWDKRLGYSLVVWTSAGAASIIVAGDISWRFNKHITVRAGYTGVPGSRSLVNTFPYYTASDRSMADNFFRPGFTQGVWATGEITNGLNYQAFVGNSVNTLNITANKIDTKLLLAGSVWWEPLGKYGEPGKSVNMYDDYFARKKVRIRLGTSFTRSPEDRFSNLDQSAPDNTALYNSDGVLTFSTGAFAPGVTVSNALYKMWAIDGGLKYNGLAINGQYYMRWLNDFVADGPIPETSTFDHGYEFSASQFVIPKKLLVYAKSSQVFGHFGNSYEYAGGVKWHFLPTERLWLNFEMMRVNKSPYSGAFTPYTAGMNGWVPMLQSIIAF